MLSMARISISTILFFSLPENNGLLFLETSALDSTNVELAFETVLKGQNPASLRHLVPFSPPISSQSSARPADTSPHLSKCLP